MIRSLDVPQLEVQIKKYPITRLIISINTVDSRVVQFRHFLANDFNLIEWDRDWFGSSNSPTEGRAVGWSKPVEISRVKLKYWIKNYEIWSTRRNDSVGCFTACRWKCIAAPFYFYFESKSDTETRISVERIRPFGCRLQECEEPGREQVTS